MRNITIRGVDEEVHAALVNRARVAKRSLEAEMRLVCAAAALPEGRVRMGEALAMLGRRFGGVELAMLRRRHDSA